MDAGLGGMKPKAGQGEVRVGRYRWVVVALLFAATAINYIDRQMIGVLKPTLAAEFNWSESDFAGIVFWFQVAYAIGYLSFGKVVDMFGARLNAGVVPSTSQKSQKRKRPNKATPLSRFDLSKEASDTVVAKYSHSS